MFSIPIWSGKVKWQLRDERGNVEIEGVAPNMIHNTGQQQFLQSYFSPLGTLLTVIEADALYDQTGHADGAKCLHSASGTDDPFTTVVAGDYLYLVGGTDNEVTAGVYVVASQGADVENGLLSSDPYAGDVAGGIVVLLARKFRMGLDARAAASVADTAAGVSGYVEDGTGYSSVSLDPHSSSNWTIAWDSTEGAYTATSAVCTFTATSTDWQGNRYFHIISHTGTLAAPAGEVLIASMSLGSTVTVGNGKSITAQYVAKLTGTNT